MEPATMCSKHSRNSTRGIVTGEADIVLRRDSKHVLQASWAELHGTVLTATTRFDPRTYSMREVIEIKWRALQAKS